jgi:diketogulonate reductase-like aldo/keto reductase
MDITTKWKLNNGVEIPVLGLGTYLSKPGKETYEAVRYALDIGYRHIDTAALYANEEDVGKAVRDSGVPREEIFVTTKVWNSDQGYDTTINAFYKSLKKLKFDYIDLYLIHWPQPKTRIDTWRALIQLYDEKKASSIGVSNYTIRHMEEVLHGSPFKPLVNQIEFSPYIYQKDILSYCNRRNIIVEAYTPLVRGKKFKDPKLVELAEKYSKTPAQIMIRWALQVGTVVLPKSIHPERIKENADIFDFEISEDDMLLMEDFNENYRVAWDPTKIE